MTLDEKHHDPAAISVDEKPSEPSLNVAAPETITQTQPASDDDDVEFPSGAKVALVMISLYLAMFLVALDRTILATAIPRITDEFDSLDDVGWYGSSYMLTACAFILIYGRIYTFYSTKWIFLTGILLFEIGSAISGAAPDSITLIVGRAIAGLGSSGIFTGAITIMINTVPLHKRPMFQGMFGAVFGVASVAGPLLGGVFTDKVSWRWCFYINLPIGAVTILVIIFILHLNEKKKTPKTIKEQIIQLDPIGTFFFLPGIVSLLLALQWGGSQYPWSNWRIILLLVVFAICIVVFILIQILHRNTTATVPARIITQRSVAFGAFFTFCVGSVMMADIFYLPFWFQAIKGSSAVKSGVQSIPLILGLVAAAIICGGLVQKTGYYTPFMFAGSIIMSVGAGMLTTLDLDSNHDKWIGYQALLGLGIGTGMQQANLAVQNCLPREDVPTGAAVIFFFQTLGGTLFVSVAQNVFIDELISRSADIPGLDPRLIVNTGATELRRFVDPNELPRVLVAYNEALTMGPFLVAVIVASLSIIGAAGMEWKSLKRNKPALSTPDVEKATEDQVSSGSQTRSS
ncbi:major facilitator superfamily transporter [Aulographum hederae CBS 113979]|uniref:Major facilitator superfamily transporter n=1 Tax=Aulographum hederae CBS 113979 TaxID=1176131 RepID=A0A6G1HGI3_9PEZI|nr:major facilitator superfamily transporter [Aulographum hederae CBS 113979]